MDKLLDLTKIVLLNIFHKRWARLMELKPENTRVNWVDGHECGERLFQICKDNKIPITVPEEIIRDGDITKWDATMLLNAILAITNSIQKGINFFLIFKLFFLKCSIQVFHHMLVRIAMSAQFAK